jgi:hypothetical protein
MNDAIVTLHRTLQRNKNNKAMCGLLSGHPRIPEEAQSLLVGRRWCWLWLATNPGISAATWDSLWEFASSEIHPNSSAHDVSLLPDLVLHDLDEARQKKVLALLTRRKWADAVLESYGLAASATLFATGFHIGDPWPLTKVRGYLGNGGHTLAEILGENPSQWVAFFDVARGLSWDIVDLCDVARTAALVTTTRSLR